MMQNRRTRSGSVILLGIAVCLGICVATGYAGQMHIASAQALSQGRTFGGVTYTPVGENGLRVDFARASVGSPVTATIVADEGVVDSPFVGDYIEQAINSISLQVSGSGHQPAVAIVLLDTATRKWRCDIPVPSTPDSTVEVSLPLTTADGWTASGIEDVSPAAVSAMFGADLTDVVSLSIAMLPYKVAASYPAQYYTFSDLVLVNDDGISSRPASLTPLEKAFIARFGYGYGSPDALTAEMRGWDEDGDGMADFMELWSENDREYANSIFSAEDIEVVVDGVNVTWTCVAGETYTVLRADSLTGDFTTVDGLTATAAETGFMTLKDMGAAAGGYYRIRKQ